MRQAADFTRRAAVRAMLGAAVFPLIACGPAPETSPRGAGGGAGAGEGTRAPRPAAAREAMTVYRDPSCGCCSAWAEIARRAGHQVTVIDHPDMPAIKRQFGVPDELLSCHTTLVGGYAVEGHVPLEAVERLLATRPPIRGIAVPGMPLGSPGMEVPDGTVHPFEVMAFGERGEIAPFAGQRGG